MRRFLQSALTLSVFIIAGCSKSKTPGPTDGETTNPPKLQAVTIRLQKLVIILQIQLKLKHLAIISIILNTALSLKDRAAMPTCWPITGFFQMAFLPLTIGWREIQVHKRCRLLCSKQKVKRESTLLHLILPARLQQLD